MTSRTQDNLAIFGMVCTGIIIGVAVITFLTFYFGIEVERMRNETPQQKAYNSCVRALSASYQKIDPNQCAYTLKAAK